MLHACEVLLYIEKGQGHILVGDLRITKVTDLKSFIVKGLFSAIEIPLMMIKKNTSWFLPLPPLLWGS